MLHFLGVTKLFPGGQVALENVSFEIPSGQFAFVTGPSGAGKTTLLRLLYRESVPTSGQVLVNGRNVAALPRKKIPFLRRTIGVVFQDFRLIPRKTVFENVSYLPRILGKSIKEQRRLALEALRHVGLAHKMSAFPPQLSGGEQQRVAIARALISNPDILIADEPTGNLDPDLSQEILNLFANIHRRGTTVLVATHEPALVDRVGGRVLILDRGQLVADQEHPVLLDAGGDAPDLDRVAASRHLDAEQS